MQSISFKTMSKDIDPAQARKAHINYLLGGPHIKTENGSVIHSLFIDKDDLAKLAEAGKDGGLRLYFCREKMLTGAASGELYLNIIGVPVNGQDENILTKINSNGDVVSAIYNNMEPCPDRCSLNKNHDASFSEKDLNYKMITTINDEVVGAWLKPKKGVSGDSGWFKEDGTIVIPQP